MNTHRRQTRRFILVVIAAFLGFLIQPQVVTLHHNHPGGEHAHIHLPSAGSQHTHDHHHSHHHSSSHHHHAHATDTHYVHTRANEHTPKATPAYTSPNVAADGHWHVVTVLHSTRLATAPWSPKHRALPFLPEDQPPILFLTRVTVFRPRAPPRVL